MARAKPTTLLPRGRPRRATSTRSRSAGAPGRRRASSRAPGRARRCRAKWRSTLDRRGSARAGGWSSWGLLGTYAGILRRDVGADAHPAANGTTPRPSSPSGRRCGNADDAFRPSPSSRDGERPAPARSPEGVRARDAAVSLGRDPHGSREELHDGRRRGALPPPHGGAVFHPMGYDAFGLPAENAAIRTGEPPGAGHRPQHRADPRAAQAPGLLDRLGHRDRHERSGVLPVDAVALPAVPRARAWPSGARRRSTGAPGDQTVLANEQVIDGRCERCGSPRSSCASSRSGSCASPTTPQRLLDDMYELIDWPERVLTMQRNWIGRSEGARVDLPHRRRGARDPGLHHPPGHAVRRHLLPARAGAPAGGRAWWQGRPEEEAVRGVRALGGAPRASADRGSRPTGPRPACSPAATSSTRSTASRSRSGWPTTC